VQEKKCRGLGDCRAFTIIELLAVLGIMSIVLSIGTANLSRLWGQMRGSEEIRRLSLDLNYARNEAVRLRSTVRVIFSATGYQIDIYGDGIMDRTVRLLKGSRWTSIPSTISFNGLGLVRGIATTNTVSVRNHGSTASLNINGNGYVQL
jgi:prepilin-type N-terminal cleavage/methylation domain-containing protein